MRSVMMVMMMGVEGSRVLIRMAPLTVTSKVRMRVTAVWNGSIDDVGGRVGRDWIGSGNGGHPGRTAEPPLVFALLFAGVVIVSIVGNDEVTITSGEGTGGR